MATHCNYCGRYAPDHYTYCRPIPGRAFMVADVQHRCRCGFLVGHMMSCSFLGTLTPPPNGVTKTELIAWTDKSKKPSAKTCICPPDAPLSAFGMVHIKECPWSG